MLSLIVFRHAKSNWQANFQSDHDRPLSQRGIRAARLMGEFLAATGRLPDLALTSSAVRARDTLDLARRQGNWECPVQVKNALYETNSRNVLSLLNELEQPVSTLLITGHEPTCSELTSQLIGAPNSLRFATGTMARIDFAVANWAEVAFSGGELRWLVPPKLFKGPVSFR